jgi:PIN domain nuclease of toxin-antitoxin system
MRLLLDTHVWLWRLLEPDRLSADAERAVADRENVLHLSPISTWETLVLARKGRVSLSPSPTEWVLDALRRSALAAVPLTQGIALRSEALDGFASADPADRFLVASALEHGLALVTADSAMHAYPPVQTVW